MIKNFVQVYRALVEENVSNHATGIILDSDALVDQVKKTKFSKIPQKIPFELHQYIKQWIFEE